MGLKELAITSNGIALHRKLGRMVEAGLTGLNLSLDTLDPFQFQIMTRRKGLFIHVVRRDQGRC
jgi:cyclic pyranopterin phosphate synthase